MTQKKGETPHWRLTDIIPDKFLFGRFAIRRANRLERELLPIFNKWKALSDQSLQEAKDFKGVTAEIEERSRKGIRPSQAEVKGMLAMNEVLTRSVTDFQEVGEQISKDPRVRRLDLLRGKVKRKRDRSSRKV
ncbi:MAG TPA: hypothetical protein VF189_01555 [Patescibacteria group bacterium]